MTNTIQIQSNKVAETIRNFGYDLTKNYGYSLDNGQIIMFSELIKNQQWRAIQIVIENMDNIHKHEILDLICANKYVWEEIFEPIDSEILVKLDEHRKNGHSSHLIPFFIKNKKIN
jgi:hypothetical protein